jgi:protein involved in polysaccharide export with SLBB domain
VRIYGKLLTPVVALAALAMPLHAQEAGGRLDSRAQLEARRDSLAGLLTGAADDERVRGLEREIAAIETRLRVGDFRAGEVVGLEVRGQPQWTGSFTVQPDQTLVLPGVPPIPMDGVLYAEAHDRIRSGLATVLRDPQLEIVTQMRIGVVGEVASPGYYDVSGSMLLSDVLMLAGGPTKGARTEKVRIRRFGETVMEGPELTAASLTLDDLGIQPGDAVEVPSKEGQYNLLRNLSLGVGIIAGTVALISIAF